MTEIHTVTFTAFDAVLYSFLALLVVASFARLAYNMGVGDTRDSVFSKWKALLANEEGSHALTRARMAGAVKKYSDARDQIAAIAKKELTRSDKTYAGASAALKKIRDITESM